MSEFVIGPYPGVAVSMAVAALETQFLSLGPFFQGSMLSHLEAVLDVDAGLSSGLSLGAVLTHSADESVANYRSGSSLIRRGDFSEDGHPVFSLTMDSDRQLRWRIPIGVLVETGSLFVLTRLESNTHAVDAQIGVFVLGVYKVGSLGLTRARLEAI